MNKRNNARGLTQVTANKIRKRIEGKLYPAGEALPPERVLAEELEVSRITIRRSLEILTDAGCIERRPGVGNFVIEHIHREKKTGLKSVGLIVGQIDNPYYSSLAKHFEQLLAERNMSLLLSVTGDNPEEDDRALERMVREQVKGIIVAVPPDETRRSELKKLNGTDISMVVLGKPGDGTSTPWDSVSSNDRSGLEAAVNHLVELGHSRIAYINAMIPGRREPRFSIMRELLKSHKLTDKYCIDAGVPDFEGGRIGLEKLLKIGGATAAIAINDVTALGMMQRAVELGVSIPGDLSIVGIDDIPQASMSSVPLTTLGTPTGEIAKFAVERLFSRIEGYDGRPIHISLEPELIVRATTAPPTNNKDV
jgi:DNA-binding LacI/PurR family transcriptional regulator